jgi:hypothetical protein
MGMRWKGGCFLPPNHRCLEFNGKSLTKVAAERSLAVRGGHRRTSKMPWSDIELCTCVLPFWVCVESCDVTQNEAHSMMSRRNLDLFIGYSARLWSSQQLLMCKMAAHQVLLKLHTRAFRGRSTALSSSIDTVTTSMCEKMSPEASTVGQCEGYIITSRTFQAISTFSFRLGYQ